MVKKFFHWEQLLITTIIPIASLSSCVCFHLHCVTELLGFKKVRNYCIKLVSFPLTLEGEFKSKYWTLTKVCIGTFILAKAP